MRKCRFRLVKAALWHCENGTFIISPSLPCDSLYPTAMCTLLLSPPRRYPYSHETVLAARPS